MNSRVLLGWAVDEYRQAQIQFGDSTPDAVDAIANLSCRLLAIAIDREGNSVICRTSCAGPERKRAAERNRRLEGGFHD